MRRTHYLHGYDRVVQLMAPIALVAPMARSTSPSRNWRSSSWPSPTPSVTRTSPGPSPRTRPSWAPTSPLCCTSARSRGRLLPPEVHEVDKRFGIPPQLDGHRDRVLERVEELVPVPDLDFLISAHPLLARQPLPLSPVEPHSVAAEPYLPHPVTGCGSYGGAHVVRELGIDQRHGGSDPITPPNRPGHDTHEFDDADRGV